LPCMACGGGGGGADWRWLGGNLPGHDRHFHVLLLHGRGWGGAGLEVAQRKLAQEPSPPQRLGRLAGFRRPIAIKLGIGLSVLIRRARVRERKTYVVACECECCDFECRA
jgi:hypothetical protein